MTLLCLEYILYSWDVLKSSLPDSTSLRVTVNMGFGRPIDSKNATAVGAQMLVSSSYTTVRRAGEL